MVILGVNAYHGDAGAALLVDGKLVAAVEEERFNRVKHWAGLPVEAIRDCLEAAGVGIEEVDHLAISRNPAAHLYQKILFALSNRPSLSLIRDRFSNAVRVRDVREKLALRFGIPTGQIGATLHWIEHHRSHMASAFFVSPFEEAACLSMMDLATFSAPCGERAGTGRFKCWAGLPFPTHWVFSTLS